MMFRTKTTHSARKGTTSQSPSLQVILIFCLQGNEPLPNLFVRHLNPTSYTTQRHTTKFGRQLNPAPSTNAVLEILI